MKSFSILSALAGFVALTAAAPAEASSTIVCEPNSTWCDGARVMTCTSKNKITVLSTCATGESCIAPAKSAPRCARPDPREQKFNCVVGSVFCDDDRVLSCNKDKSATMINDCAANNEYCVRPGKSAPHCSSRKIWIETREQSESKPESEVESEVPDWVKDVATTIPTATDTATTSTLDASISVLCGTCINQGGRLREVRATGVCNNITPNSSDERYTACRNSYCGLCIFFSGRDCQGNIITWSGRKTSFPAKGGQSHYCM
ncbi:hypothetical protein ACN47E_004538 [Coniothyrium glycines]